MPERLMPANSAPTLRDADRARLLEVERVEAPALLASRCCAVGCLRDELAHRGAAAHPLAEQAGSRR